MPFVSRRVVQGVDIHCDEARNVVQAVFERKSGDVCALLRWPNIEAEW